MAVELAAVELPLQVRCPQSPTVTAVGTGAPKLAAVFANQAGGVPTAPNQNAPTTAKTRDDAWMGNVNASTDLVVMTAALSFAFWIVEITVIASMVHVFVKRDSLVKTAHKPTASTTAWVAANA